MKKCTVPFLMTALALAVPAALAQQASPGPTAAASLSGISTNVTGDNPFRFYEYRDLESGVSLGFDGKGESNAWYWNLFGENIGRDDRFMQLKGGKYGVFKYSLYNDEVIHNLTYGAITPMVGIGSNSLTFSGTSASPNMATWNSFDYSVQHSNVGGFMEAQADADSPFYLRIGANHKKSDGIKPLGVGGTSPGGPVYELPAPIDWTTTDISGEIGYATKTSHYSASVLYSKFEDQNDYLSWRSPIIATGPNVESSTLAADNKLMRLGLNAMWKQLPMASTLALRGTYAKLDNSFPVPPTYISVSGTTGNTRLSGSNEPTFSGEVVNKSLSASLNSQLAKNLDSRVYYNWYERENDSTHVVFTPSGPGSGGTCDPNLITGVAGTTCTPEHLHFTKNNMGIELRYRLDRQNKFSADIDYLDTERERVDFDRSKETRYTLEWKHTGLEVADVRLKYQYLQRRSDFLLANSTVVFNKYQYRFDVAPLDRSVLKAVFDASPAPGLDLGFEVILKRNEYKDVVLGRTEDTRQEYYFTASYGDPNRFRITGFADYERTQYDSNHWVGATTAYPVPSSTAYPWQGEVKDRNYLLGIGADWIVSDKFKVKGSAILQKTDGSVDFTTPNNYGNPVPIDQYDNFRKKSFDVRGVWAASNTIDVSFGYAYEKYDYSDIQMDGYIPNIVTGTTQHFFSGAYASPTYKANVVYATFTYKFR